MKIYDILGLEVATLENGKMPAGSYDVRWDGRDPDGSGGERSAPEFTFIHYEQGNSSTKRMLLLQ